MEKLISKIAEAKEKLNKAIEEFEKEKDATISEKKYMRILLIEKYIKGLEDALEMIQG